MKENESTVSFSLTVKRASDALEFYTRALGAVELFRMPTPDGGLAHAEFIIGNTRIFMSDESPEWHAAAMPEGTTAACLFSIQTDSCDTAFKQAVEAGGEALSGPEDQFWGHRSAMIRDPFGYRWSFSELIEELTPEEVAKRAQELFGG